MANRRTKYSDISRSGGNLVDVTAVIDAVRNILLTRVGEHPFNREFGSYIEDYLFEPFSFSTSRMILSEVIASVSRWEKRVTIIPDSDVQLDLSSRKYHLKLYVEVQGFSDVIPIEEEFQAKEAV